MKARQEYLIKVTGVGRIRDIEWFFFFFLREREGGQKLYIIPFLYLKNYPIPLPAFLHILIQCFKIWGNLEKKLFFNFFLFLTTKICGLNILAPGIFVENIPVFKIYLTPSHFMNIFLFSFKKYPIGLGGPDHESLELII